MTHRHASFLSLAVLSAAAAFSGLPQAAQAQDFNAMLAQQEAQMQQYIQAQQAQMNANIAAGQRQVQQIVQQKMQDPQVQQAYQQHLAQARQQGAQPYDFPTFAYYYAATNGFSAQGRAAYAANERDIQGKEAAAMQGYRTAQAGAAGGDERLAGRLLAQSTGGGAPVARREHLREPRQRSDSAVAAHLAASTRYHTHQGNTYYVDASGRYWMADPNNSGIWQPLQPAR